MKLRVIAAASAGAFVWGILVMLFTGVVHAMRPSYGTAFLDVMASLYPGYTGAPTLGQALVGTLYGLADGAVCGAAVALAYNLCAGRTSRPT